MLEAGTVSTLASQRVKRREPCSGLTDAVLCDQYFAVNARAN